MKTQPQGRFIGVGVGPGDPELITLKADRLIRDADVLCYLANSEGHSQARRIARDSVNRAARRPQECPIVMPMCQDRVRANAVYDEAADVIGRYLEAGSNVVFLCEGDPLFYGSLAYLLDRLQPAHDCEVVPGIASPMAAAARLGRPIACLSESFAVVSGRHDDDTLRRALAEHDSLVIMKVGRQRRRLLSLLEASGRIREARYLEYIGRPDERIVTDVRELTGEAEAGPYFSLFVVRREAS